jgi:hypothetical protein
MSVRIVRSEHYFGELPGVETAMVSAHVHAIREGMPLPATTGRLHSRRAHRTAAYVNHGRWVVDCPFCPSASFASPSDPRFFCAACRNGFVGGDLVHVDFPDEIDAIEAALLARPNEVNRNWTPAETLDDLHAQNADNLLDGGASAPGVGARRRGRRPPAGTEPGL